MKKCGKCGKEVDALDGDDLCPECAAAKKDADAAASAGAAELAKRKAEKEAAAKAAKPLTAADAADIEAGLWTRLVAKLDGEKPAADEEDPEPEKTGGGWLAALLVPVLVVAGLGAALWFFVVRKETTP